MNFSIRDAVDIAIVTVILYNLLMATKGTRAIQVFKGIGLLLVGAVIADFFKLASVQWLLNTLLQSGVIFLIILFQPTETGDCTHMLLFKMLYLICLLRTEAKR